MSGPTRPSTYNPNPLRFAYGIVAVCLVCLGLALAGAAGAASVSYVGADGNVWLATPDGQVTKQVTGDGAATPEGRYKTPSQKDDGTIVALKKVNGSTSAANFISRDGQLLDTWLLPKTGAGSFAPFNGGEISPDGGMFVYDWRYFDCWTNPCSSDQKVSFISGPGITNPCLINCHGSVLRPRWIPGTPYAGMLDEQFLRVYVQRAGSAEPVGWLGFGSASEGHVESFDVANGITVLEVTGPGSDVSEFGFFDNNGTPPGGSPALRCGAAGIGEAPTYPQLSPDGSMVTWSTDQGVLVSPVPAQRDGRACQLQPTLIAAGGIEPSWGQVDLPRPEEPKDPDDPEDPDDPRDPKGPKGPKPNDPKAPYDPPKGAGLKALATGATLKVRAGRTIKAPVRVGAGEDGPAEGAKVCFSLPKAKRAAVKVPGCRSLGTIAAGTAKTIKATIRTTAKAKGMYRVKVTATSKGDGTRTGTLKLKVTG